MAGDKRNRITVETERTLIVAHQRSLRVMCPNCGTGSDTVVANGADYPRIKGLEIRRTGISEGVSHGPGTPSLFSRLWSLFRRTHLHTEL